MASHGREFFLVQFGLVEQGGDQRGEQIAFFQEGGGVPGAAQGHAHIAIAEFHRDVQLFRCLRGGEQFRPGHDAQLAAEFFLVGGEDQVDQQGGQLPVADHLAEIEVFPVAALRQGGVAFFVEFDADGIRPFPADHLLDQVGRLAGDVGRAHQEHGLVRQRYADDLLGVGTGRKVGCGHAIRGKQ